MSDPISSTVSASQQAGLDATSPSFYQPLADGRFQPTLHAQGAWSDHEQHMGPASGLLAHCLEQHQSRADLQLARINYEILGMIAAEPTEVQTRTLRPGRTIELLEATMIVRDRPVVRATAWRLSRHDTTAVAGGQPEPMPGPDGLPAWFGSDVWTGGYIAAVDFRVVPGGKPGRVQAWLRTDKTLVEGADSTDEARFIGLIDTANGIATRVKPSEWMFPNTDLTIHLHRTPSGPWVGLDTTVTFGPSGVGLTSSTLFDIHGAVGRSEQILTVRPVPSR